MKGTFFLLLFACVSVGRLVGQVDVDLYDRVVHHHAENQGVKIHYVTLGEGPVIVMLHGFPDFWYTWRHQMEFLSRHYKVVAVDLRGYNKSDKPKGVENYSMRILMKDVIAVIDDLKVEKAIVMANDWGGAIAWQLATYYPDRIDRLIACNIPHPSGIGKYLEDNPRTGQYAQDFKKEKSEETISVDGLLGLHNNLSAQELARYKTAFVNSDFEAMLNYYKANYPAPSKNQTEKPVSQKLTQSKINCPVLIIYGVLDKALPPGMLNNTWDFIDNELTIFTIHDGGHFIQQEKPALVNRVVGLWLETSHQ